MKKLSILIVVCIFQISSFSQGLNDICAPTNNLVYAAGNNGVILRSSTGGSLFSKMVITTENLNSIFSVGSRVWCAGDNGSFFISGDFGANWMNMNLSSNNLNSVHFIDSLIGFAAGNNGTVLKSTNGGLNWNSLTSGVLFNIKKIKFINSMTGYCTGSSQNILKTIDGGVTWSQIPVTINSTLTTFDVKADLIIAAAADGLLYKSVNSGLNWTVINLKVITKPLINDIDIRDSVTFHLLFESGSIWYSTNGGQSFNYPTNAFMDELSAFCFSTQRAFASGKKQTAVAVSTSPLLSWILANNTTYTYSFETLITSFSSNRNKVFDINYQNRGGLYVLQKNKLWRSANFGLNWSLLSTIPFDTTIATATQLLVCMKDSSKMLAGINKFYGSSNFVCELYRTDNYGLNWALIRTISMDPIGNFMNQDPQHPDTVYMGVNDSVFRSSDFGASWVKIATGPYDDWCDIAVKYDDSQILYSSTNHYPAKLHKSTNGGLNWFMVDLVADTSYSEMPAIALSNLRTNIILHAQLGPISSSTGLKRSFTDGNSWLFNQLPGTSWAIDIAKDDPGLFAYGNVSYDPVFISTNSGGVFTGTPNMYAEQLFFYDRSNLFINDHGAISKLKVTYNMPVIGIQNISSEVPAGFLLEQNYPNPFNPETNINFSLPKRSRAELIIYDITGKEVIELADEFLEAGNYRVSWNASGYASGIYFYKLITGEFIQTKKMVLIK